MEIEYHYTKEDFAEFNKAYIKNSLKRKLWGMLLFTFFAMAYFAQEPFSLLKFLIGTTASVIIFLATSYFIPLLISNIRLNKILTKDKSALEKKNLTLTSEGILIKSESNTTIRNWESIVSVHSLNKFIYLTLADKKVLLFPKKYFQSDAEAINFLGVVQSKIIQMRGATTHHLINSNKKPSYYLGLLCLIPVFGAVVGIILLMNGISKYKDKWFILIGAGGIIYTLLICLIFLNPLNKAMRTAFVPHAQMAVNELMKSVEFYKLKYGAYPDSLEQLKDNGLIWMEDPIQSAAFDKNSGHTKFNYQKVGDHYYLFSSGVDGLPNTKDDIYPQVAKEDSSKFGLIRK